MSDPYLGYASPVESVESLRDIGLIIGEIQPGALAFGKACDGYEDPIVWNHSWGKNDVPLRCRIETQLSLEEALQRKQTEWEMWEEIDVSNGEASTEAAIALNAWLWEHCGGWRNTFG